MLAWYVPAEHAAHEEAAEAAYWPGKQAVQLVAADADADPAAHVAQPDAPLAALKAPAAQEVQAEAVGPE